MLIVFFQNEQTIPRGTEAMLSINKAGEQLCVHDFSLSHWHSSSSFGALYFKVRVSDSELFVEF